MNKGLTSLPCNYHPDSLPIGFIFKILVMTLGASLVFCTLVFLLRDQIVFVVEILLTPTWWHLVAVILFISIAVISCTMLSSQISQQTEPLYFKTKKNK